MCGEKLKEAEQRVEKLVKDSQGGFREEPLEGVTTQEEGD
jgi:exonuclease VII small subunit